MDYTTLASVKDELGSAAAVKDTLLNRLITAASRAVDRHCTDSPLGDNYFMQEAVVNEAGRAHVYQGNVITLFPHKPVIASVGALSFRQTPLDSWVTATLDYLEYQNDRLLYWGTEVGDSVQYLISYTGGFSTTQAGLPADLIEAATVLAVRYFREAFAGLSDAIGVDDLGTLIYTKAMPSRVREMLQKYKRVVPW